MIGMLVALFVIIQNFPSRFASINDSVLTNLALNSIALFTASTGLHFALKDGLVSMHHCSQTFLTLALGVALGGVGLIVVGLSSLAALGAVSFLGLVLLGPVLGLSVGYNMLFFGLFRQVEERRVGQKITSLDLTARRNFVSVLGLLNAYVSPPLALLLLGSQYVLAASLALLQVTVSSLAIGLHHFSVNVKAGAVPSPDMSGC